jgi:RecJ-like exonuclease
MYICDECGDVFSTPEFHKGTDICPGCGNKYFDEAVQCKICGEYVSNEDAYGYGHDLVCRDCVNSRKDDMEFLASCTQDHEEVEIPVIYRYIFSDDEINAILYHAAKAKQERSDLDLSDFVSDYANDIAETYIKEEGK